MDLNSLEYENERYRIASKISDEIIVDYDVVNDILSHIDDKAEKLYGVPKVVENVSLYMKKSGVIVPDYLPRVCELIDQLRKGIRHVSIRVPVYRKDGKLRWLEGEFSAIVTEGDQVSRAVGVIKDITSQKHKENNSLGERKEKEPDQQKRETFYPDDFTRDVALYTALCNSTEDYIYMCDVERDLYYFPQAMVEEFGLPGQVVEHAAELWSQRIHPSAQEEFLNQMQAIADGKRNTHYQEYRVKDRYGEWVWLRCRGYVVYNEKNNQKLFAGILTNLAQKSKIDFMTGLPNKYEFERYILTELRREGTGGAILILGLDNLKNVNNLYGWQFGDRVIGEIAKKMQSYLPEEQLYRLDGDKFGIFFKGEAGEEVEAFYQKMQQEFGEHQEFSGQQYFCTVSGGYVIFETLPNALSALMKQAEFALECSKIEGKNKLNCYDVRTMGGKERGLILIESLRKSVDKGCENFSLCYQPLVQTDTKEIVGAEALLRWNCEEYGAISPVEFIPLLEQTGLIHTVGRWVILKAFEACKKFRQWIPQFYLNVNLSYMQLQDVTFLTFLEACIQKGELDSKMVHLEVTESCVATRDYSLSGAFTQLRQLGFPIKIDDFGTGYSSLEMLKRAPIDVVKIDKIFVLDITKSDFDASFIRFVVTLCHSAGMQVCLEGVESWEEFNIIKDMEIDYIQGFLFGKPKVESEFIAQYLQTLKK